ncbi:hydroxymethylglutaryl-CoA lyase [Aminithiophilus ramosus]|uniref:Hydroxymethylglutaryl-CoA lyase n=2 Tax=Synergistales TaxID=649776 RepID=A0A9Q7ADV4_9BACT|nr:hydroxymethylglutaryl-CoA lyase [Aminithiophilus ramosus]QTX32549.1 hydroxymethylglutaryl-CoA lyase [Aminithiophilus ramosus]QVL36429.1 hydroxymethylglutaryl-CoA lyase [Synergistota bacterium]
MKIPQKISVCEVGPRDGLQNEKTLLDVDKKVKFIDNIQNAGIKIIEVGSFVNPKAVPQMADTEEVFSKTKKMDGVEYRALVLNARGLDRALQCGIKKVKFTLSASRSHQIENANHAVEDIFKKLSELSDIASQNHVVLSGAVSTAFGCPFEGVVSLEKILSVVERFVEAGITEISLSDTTGMANPRQVHRTCLEMRERFPSVLWSLHFHNTRGMGLANVLAGMEAGVTRFDASLGGLGGCPFAPGATGNIATEDLLHMCEEMGIETGVDLDRVIAAARSLGDWVGHELPGAVLKAGKTGDLHRRCAKNPR